VRCSITISEQAAPHPGAGTPSLTAALKNRLKYLALHFCTEAHCPQIEHMHIVILDQQTFDHGDLDLRHLYQLGNPCIRHALTRPEECAAKIRDAEIVIANKVELTAATLASASRLKLICVAATGVNNINMDTAKRNKIAVCNARGYATPSVVQHVFAGLLHLITQQPNYLERVRRGAWCSSAHFSLFDQPIGELNGKIFGVIGYGELGQAVARVAQALGMSVIIAARRGESATPDRRALDHVIREADVLSLHCPLNTQTRGLMGARELGAMKPGAILINTARGGIVEEPALAEALRNGHLSGALVDVLSQEPPAPEHILLAPDIPNLLLTPHNAWASQAARQRLVDQIVENIVAYQQGNPCRIVA
jgi:glycerate dehydrogenase